MVQAKVTRWDKNLAIRIPLDVAKQAGLVGGERVEIEVQAGEIVIRSVSSARKTAAIAAEDIIAERQRYRLDRKAILRLVTESRR